MSPSPRRPTAALAAASLLTALAACGGGTPPEPATPAAAPAPVDPIAAWNARAREAGAVVERVGDVEVSDPFRALEEMTPLTEGWVSAQSARTLGALAGGLSAADRQRLEALFSLDLVSGPALAGDAAVYLRRDGAREQPVLVRRALGGAEGDATTLVDPAEWGERAALDWYFPSPDGRFVAFGVSQNGDERSTLHVLDVARGVRLPDVIARTKWCRLAWLPDASGFYYTRYPAPGEQGWDAAQPESYHRRLFFHRLGTDPAADPLVFDPVRKTDSASPVVSEDGRWLVVTSFRGWSSSDVYVFDRGRAARDRVDAPTPDRPLATVVEGVEAIFVAQPHRGRLYVLTNHEAPSYRVLVARDPGAAGAPGALEVLVPEDPAAPIETWAFTRDRLVLETIEDVASRLRVHDLRGRRLDDLALPPQVSVTALDGEAEGDRLVLGVEGYLVPPSVRVASLGRRPALRVLDEVRADFDFDAYEAPLVRVPSTGGVEVPATIVRPRREAEGTRVIATGYGGFNIALLPRFSSAALFWIERGDAWIVANLRGGGEFGEAWHRAGNRERKAHVFEDFEAVLRWVAAEGIAPPARIGITGRSNGGLLVGATVTRAPDAMGAAAAYVGLHDMVRFPRFPPAELWTGEYGDPAVPEELAWLLAYSPYHQVRDGVPYPAVLVEAAEADTRVHWAHSTKLAARLQEATASEAPVYFHLQRQMGHGRGTRRSDLVDEYARLFAFFDQTLGGR